MTTAKNRKHRKRPGRPGADTTREDSREALIEAASGLFAERGADAVSVREVAEAAGVSAAMINYYFSNKQGLMRAVLERGLDRVLEVITEVANDHDAPAIENFIDHYIRAIHSDPSLPQLMVREVLSGNPEYQQVISERFASKAIALMPPRLAEEMAKGRVRTDLDPRLVLLSLVGMCVFPFIAAPLLKPALGFQYDDEFADNLVAHTKRLFTEGVRRGAKGGDHE